MRILLTGLSGFVGAALMPRLLEQGHELRALARDRERVRRALAFGGTANLDDVDLRLGDTLSGEGVTAAMRGIDVAYYLIHSMEPTISGTDGSFLAREQAAADTFSGAARAAGVQRIVYLGGLLPSRGRPSTHLLSRHTVERILLEALPDSVALRASIVIGARSRSFRFLVRLVERMPVLALPAWHDYRTQPIDERDVVEMLTACATNPIVGGSTLDIGGPDPLSYRELIERIASLMMLSRPSVGLRFNLTPLAARLAASIAREQPELITPLMEGLTGDLLPANDNAADMLGVELHGFDAAVEHALRDWERVEPLAAR
ncbi:MAG TPA: NAD(P)H-binding protein [Solirubrobacteraceae bacterium]|nr:NAD(P)H-binding protein [Solirubrobacteraceae bacterium]